MSLALDHLIFGNGHGMASPYWDRTYHWLVDTYGKKRHGRHGRLYSFSMGFGAQLTSEEWRMPAPGTRRRLNGREYVVFSAHRKWCRVQVSWALADLKGTIDERNAKLRTIQSELMRSTPEPND